MFKCIKEVPSSDGVIFFQAGKIYFSPFNNEYTIQEVVDETGEPHIIGREGEEWFNDHFRELTDEEYMEFMIESYSEMPNHDEIETKALQENIKKRIEDAVAPYKAFYDYFNELYGKGLEVANWHQNGDLEPFDEFFMSAEQEMENEISTIERKKEIVDFANKACERNDAALKKLSE